MKDEKMMLSCLPKYTENTRCIVFQALEDRFLTKQIAKVFQDALILANKTRVVTTNVFGPS